MVRGEILPQVNSAHEGVMAALGELEVGYEELSQFLGSVFDRFQSWAEQLRDRQTAIQGACATTSPSDLDASSCKRCLELLEELRKGQTSGKTEGASLKSVEDLLQKKLDGVTNSVGSVANQLDKLQEAIQSLQPEKATQSILAAIAKLTEQLDAIGKALGTLQAEHSRLVQTLQDLQKLQFSEELQSKLEAVRQALEKLQQDGKQGQADSAKDFGKITAAVKDLASLIDEQNNRLATQITAGHEHLANLLREEVNLHQQLTTTLEKQLDLLSNRITQVIEQAMQKPAEDDEELAQQITEVADGDLLLDSLASQIMLLRKDAAKRRKK